jgi:hypothetical protein
MQTFLTGAIMNRENGMYCVEYQGHCLFKSKILEAAVAIAIDKPTLIRLLQEHVESVPQLQ